MSYNDREESLDEGAPYFLYEFKRGEDTWRFAGAETIIESPEGVKYEPSSIRHTAINQSGDIERITIDITFPLTHPFAVEQRQPGISEVTTITIYRGHYGLAPGNEQVVFKGRAISYNITNVDFTLVCENLQTSLRRVGLRGKFHRTCRHILYGNGCKLDIENFYTSVEVTGTTTGSVTIETVEGKTDVEDFYTGGIIRFNGEVFFVLKHNGNTLQVLNPIQSISTEDIVEVAPGCNLSRKTCSEKFNNSDNFGGFAFIPNRNPFKGFVGEPVT